MKKKSSKVVAKVAKKVSKPKAKKVAKVAKVSNVAKVASTEVVEVVNKINVKILASIVHPNKKILAEKILNKVPVEQLNVEYGKIRVAEMNSYIKSFTANLEKNSALAAKRGCNGVCVVCQK